MTRVRGESGSTVPLILVCFLFAAALIVVAAAGTALHLERLRLLTLADGAALAAAESFPVVAVHVDADAVTPTLTASEVEGAARAYLADARTDELDGIRLVSATAPRGRSAAVTVSAVWHPPIVSSLLPVAVPIQASSSARAVFR